MEPTTYKSKQDWMVRIFRFVFNYTGITMPIWFPIYVILRFWQEGRVINFASEAGFYLAIYLLVFSVFAGANLVFTANYFAEITVEADAVYVSFLWLRLRVTYEDIIDIKPMPFALPWQKRKEWVVYTKSLTPFHRLYGLSYGFSLHPSFIIAFSVNNREEAHQKNQETSHGIFNDQNNLILFSPSNWP